MLTWDEPKRKLNIKNHGLDFVAGDAIWDHFTVTREDVAAKGKKNEARYYRQVAKENLG